MIAEHVGGDSTTGPWPGWYTASIVEAHAELVRRRGGDAQDLWSEMCSDMSDAEIIDLGGRRVEEAS